MDAARICGLAVTSVLVLSSAFPLELRFGPAPRASIGFGVSPGIGFRDGGHRFAWTFQLEGSFALIGRPSARVAARSCSASRRRC